MNEYKCPVCGNVTYSSSPLIKVKCQNCGCVYNVNGGNAPQQGMGNNNGYQNNTGGDVFSTGPSGKSRGVAALLAILLGALGIHYFYLGKNTAGVICLILTLLSCGIAATLLSIMGLVQGILMFTMSEQEFENRYVYTNSTFPF